MDIITAFLVKLLVVLLFGHTELGEFSINHFIPMLHVIPPENVSKVF